MHILLYRLILRKHIGNAFKSTSFSDVDSATCDDRVSVIASGKLTSSLEV